MEEHLPLHLGQARVEREKEERRKAVSKVLIASRSVADCDLQVVSAGLYSQEPDKVSLNSLDLTLTFNNLARPLCAKNKL